MIILYLPLVLNQRITPYAGSEIKNLFTMRNLDDANSIEPYMRSGMHLLIVGGGYLG